MEKPQSIYILCTESDDTHRDTKVLICDPVLHNSIPVPYCVACACMVKTTACTVYTDK